MYTTSDSVIDGGSRRPQWTGEGKVLYPLRRRRRGGVYGGSWFLSLRSVGWATDGRQYQSFKKKVCRTLGRGGLRGVTRIKAVDSGVRNTPEREGVRSGTRKVLSSWSRKEETRVSRPGTPVKEIPRKPRNGAEQVNRRFVGDRVSTLEVPL